MTFNQTSLSLERTLAVIGSASVGKSALSQVFVQKTFPQEYFPTIEKIHQIETFQNNNGSSYKLTLFDTAGLESQASIPGKYINSHGFVLVYSVCDRQSFDIIKELYDKLKDDTLKQNIHIVLIGNKTDLNDQRCVTYEDGLSLAEEWRNSGTIVTFIETSAKTGEKVQDVFSTLLSLIDCSIESTSQFSSDLNDNQVVHLKNDKKLCTIS